MSNPYEHRRQIDKMVDYRRAYRPNDTAPIRLKLTGEEIHKAVGYPVPRPPHPCPNSCWYRGYRLEVAGSS